MEMRSLSLSLPLVLSQPASLSLQTSKRGYASNVFLRSWSAAKSYKWSGEREREGRREGEREEEEEIEQNAEEAGRSGGLVAGRGERKDERDNDEKGNKGSRRRKKKNTGTKRGTDPRALPLLLFLCIL